MDEIHYYEYVLYIGKRKWHVNFTSGGKIHPYLLTGQITIVYDLHDDYFIVLQAKGNWKDHALRSIQYILLHTKNATLESNLNPLWTSCYASVVDFTCPSPKKHLIYHKTRAVTAGLIDLYLQGKRQWDSCRGPCGWWALSEFLTVIITHSQAQLSTWESSIQNPTKPAVSPPPICDLVWPLTVTRCTDTFAILDEEFYGGLPWSSSQ